LRSRKIIGEEGKNKKKTQQREYPDTSNFYRIDIEEKENRRKTVRNRGHLPPDNHHNHEALAFSLGFRPAGRAICVG
jgi:hypothetical protein